MLFVLARATQQMAAFESQTSKLLANWPLTQRALGKHRNGALASAFQKIFPHEHPLPQNYFLHSGICDSGALVILQEVHHGPLELIETDFAVRELLDKGAEVHRLENFFKELVSQSLEKNTESIEAVAFEALCFAREALLGEVKDIEGFKPIRTFVFIEFVVEFADFQKASEQIVESNFV